MVKRLTFILSFVVFYICVLLLTIAGAYYFAFQNKVYPGVYIGSQHIGNWTKQEVVTYFKEKNRQLEKTKIVFNWNGRKWEMTGKEAGLHYDSKRIADQAYVLGREGNVFINSVFLAGIYTNGFQIETPYYSEDKNIISFLKTIAAQIDTAPIEGLYEFKDGKITAFKPSYEGRSLDVQGTNRLLADKLSTDTNVINIALPIKMIKPKVGMSEADKLGIKDLIGRGESYFFDSIPSRMHNIKLGSSKFHGLLVSPDEVFSFNQNVGTISAYTGFKQAYVIEKGKTVLGDGGGVCQVSTTLFRATLRAGLPIVERVPHAYRVGYYEYNSPVGFDASIYDPKPDFRFKNDTGHHILIQTFYDETNKRLTFELYGTSDGRVSVLSDPVFVSRSPAPEPVYQDDPDLPKGTEKQVETAHPGAKVYFTRTITRLGQEPVDETFWSNYKPWAAVILRGTKE